MCSEAATAWLLHTGLLDPAGSRPQRLAAAPAPALRCLLLLPEVSLSLRLRTQLSISDSFGFPVSRFGFAVNLERKRNSTCVVKPRP